MRKKWIIGILAVTLILGVSGCGQSTSSKKNTTSTESSTKNSGEEKVLRYGYVATNSDVLSGLNGIALEQGYFEEELSAVNAVFKAVPFAKAGPAVNSALASDELDIAGLGDVPGTVAKANGADTILTDVQAADYSTHLLIRNDLDITDVKELKGLKIAVQTGSYMQRILYQILEQNGLSPEDVEIVNMTEIDAANAIASGGIDATPVTAQKGYTLESNGSAKLLLDTKGDESTARLSVTVARTEYAKENEEVLVAYYKALIRAEEYAKEHPEDLKELYIKAGTDEKILDMVYPNLSDYNSTVGATKDTLASLQNVAAFIVDNNLAKTEVSIDEWYNGTFYEKAKEELANE